MHTDPGAAIAEFKELAATAPDWPLAIGASAAPIFGPAGLTKRKKNIAWPSNRTQVRPVLSMVLEPPWKPRKNTTKLSPSISRPRNWIATTPLPTAMQAASSF